MRNIVFGMAIAFCMAIGGVSTASAAAPVDPGIGKVETLVQKTASDYCTYLKYKCENKGGLGERGEGNCRRYRNECRQISRCERLRRACVYKEERGEEGQGNCRRYRNECGGDRDY